MSYFKSLLINATDQIDNQKNKSWWENNPMTYDWENKIDGSKLTKEYFGIIDDAFGAGHSLCNNPLWPNGYILENFIPYANLKNKDVLEIGCGAGLVASHLVGSGAKLSAIDITEKAITITRKRFEIYNLVADIRQMDAEKIDYADQTFDFVISWGVIHHSGNMQSIIDEIHRVLKKNGKAFIMIYNKDSLRLQVYCRFWLGIIRLKSFKYSLEEIGGSITDGYIARHLTKKVFSEMTHQFSDIKFSYSDEPQTIANYLFGPLRRLYKFFPESLKRKFESWLARRWGWYLQVVLTK